MGHKKRSGAKRSSAESAISDCFQHSLRFIRSITRSPDGPEDYNFSGAVLKRRKAAVSSYMETAKARYSAQYPQLDIETEWARLCAAPRHSVDWNDHFYFISVAASIWILDELRERGKSKKAIQYLPEEIEEPEDLPDGYFDPCHDVMLLQKMLYLLKDRDGQAEGYQWYVNDVTAARRKPEIWIIPDKPVEALNSRERFNAILSMIPPATVQRASALFEKKMWEYADRYFACIGQYAEEERQHGEKCDRLWDESVKLHRKLGFAPFDGEKSPIPKAPLAVQLTDYSAFQQPAATTLESMLDVKVRQCDELKILSESGLAESDAADALERKRMGIGLAADGLPMLEGETLDDWITWHGEDAYQRLIEFTVDEPYETCFAFLCLIESGSDLPWLYVPALAVLTAAAAKLPWTAAGPDDDDGEDDSVGIWEPTNPEIEHEFDWLDEEMDEVDGIVEPDADCTDKDAQVLMAAQDWSLKKAELYDLKYTPEAIYHPLKPEQPARNVNLPQLVYKLSGLVMPRGVREYDGIGEDLALSGVPEAESRAWEHYLQLAADVQRMRRGYLQGVMKALEEYYNVMLEEDGKAVKSAEMARVVDALEAKIDALRGELHETTRKYESSLKEIQRLREEKADEHRELADLRELIFNQEADYEPELPAAKAIEFPYRVQKRTVIFGGHDTWLKAIRPLLPGVVFVSRESKPNTEMIRHADVVWIQTNALSHAHYYKIIDIVRVNHIPVRYFAYASAEKGATQLAIADIENAARN